MKLNVNGKAVTVSDAPDTPLLWVIRDSVGLTGTKFGCGVAQCGACTVLVNGEATRSCSVPVGSVAGKHVTTIEGLAHGETLSRVQQAWVDAQVPQCGYCQSGMIVATTALLAKHPDYVTGYFQLGQLYAKLMRPADARKILTAGIDAAARTGDQHAAGEMSQALAELPS